MKVIGIIGYKKSGKSTLVVQLAKELAGRGYKITTIKHTEEEIDLASTDSARHKKYAENAVIISREEAAIFFKGRKTLEEMLKYIEADYIIAEGFKKEKTFPKIVCLRNQEEQEALFDGLEIAVVGDKIEGLSVPALKDIKEIADLVEKKAFKLPALNCGACGFDYCYELAKEIVKGNRKIDDCVSLQPETVVKIGGEAIPLNPFISRMVRNTIKGLLSTLKGLRAGNIEIKIG